MAATAEAAQRASEPVLPVVRAGVGVLLVLALANGVFLYFLPSQADGHYAWAVKPPASAAAMGAGYLAGLLATALASAARDWRSFRSLVPGFFVLGVTLIAATLINADRFRWGYPPTWIWTGVYTLLPPLAVYFWHLQAVTARGSRAAAHNVRLASLRPLALTVGIAAAAAGVALLAAPGALLAAWGWTITPLLARVFAGWYLLAACTLVCLAWSYRQPHEVPIPCATFALWSALMLLIPLLHRGDVRSGATLFWPWIAFHAVTLATCFWLVLRSLHLMRSNGSALRLGAPERS